MKSNGFAAVYILLILVLGLAAGTGWYVYQSQQDEQATQQTEQKPDIVAEDSTGTISYAYPAGWQLKPHEWENCCDSDQVEPDWTKVSRPIILLPEGVQAGDSYANERTAVSINFIDNTEPYGRVGTAKNFEELKESINSDPWFDNTFETVTINGREALYNRTDYLGPPDAKVESFTDHRYYFFNEGKLIEVYFLEKKHHDWHPEQEVDNSQYKADYEKIARSIKFL